MQTTIWLWPPTRPRSIAAHQNTLSSASQWNMHVDWHFPSCASCLLSIVHTSSVLRTVHTHLRIHAHLRDTLGDITCCASRVAPFHALLQAADQHQFRANRIYGATAYNLSSWGSQVADSVWFQVSPHQPIVHDAVVVVCVAIGASLAVISREHACALACQL